MHRVDVINSKAVVVLHRAYPILIYSECDKAFLLAVFEESLISGTIQDLSKPAYVSSFNKNITLYARNSLVSHDCKEYQYLTEMRYTKFKQTYV